jgi:hypothetical protein
VAALGGAGSGARRAVSQNRRRVVGREVVSRHVLRATARLVSRPWGVIPTFAGGTALFSGADDPPAGAKATARRRHGGCSAERPLALPGLRSAERPPPPCLAVARMREGGLGKRNEGHENSEQPGAGFARGNEGVCPEVTRVHINCHPRRARRRRAREGDPVNDAGASPARLVSTGCPLGGGHDSVGCFGWRNNEGTCP